MVIHRKTPSSGRAGSAGRVRPGRGTSRRSVAKQKLCPEPDLVLGCGAPGNTSLSVEVAGPVKKRQRSARRKVQWTAPGKTWQEDTGREGEDKLEEKAEEEKLEEKEEARAVKDSAPGPVKDCAPCPASGFEGIHWKKNTRSWQVRVANEYRGSSLTLEGAVRILELASGVPARKVLPAHRLRRSRLEVLHGTFHGCLPGDVEAAAMAFTGVLTSLHEDMPQTSHRDMFDEDPLWEVLSIQGKTGPWKNALHAAWTCRKTQLPEGREMPPHWIHALVLLRALERMSGKNFQAWSDSCGRNNQFHSGWLALVQSLGIIEPDLEKAGQFILGQSGKHFRKSVDMMPAFARLTQMRAGAAALKLAWGQPLESVHDWAESYNGVKVALAEAARCAGVSSIPRLNHRPGVRGTGGYLLPWTFRVGALTRTGHLRPEPSLENLRAPRNPGRPPGLKGREHLSLQKFSGLFPDQNSWIRKLQNHKGKGCTLKGFLDQIGLGGEAIELATMWMCLLMDEGLEEENEFYVEHREALWQECAEHRCCYGFWPHPLVATKRFHSAESPEADVVTSSPLGWPQRRLRRKTAAPPEVSAPASDKFPVSNGGPVPEEEAPVTPVPHRRLERRESEVPTLPMDSPPVADLEDE
jgi:hypothetical protein